MSERRGFQIQFTMDLMRLTFQEEGSGQLLPEAGILLQNSFQFNTNVSYVHLHNATFAYDYLR
jgi:hypothetical protein